MPALLKEATSNTFKSSALAPASPGTGAGGSCTTVTPGKPRSRPSRQQQLGDVVVPRDDPLLPPPTQDSVERLLIVQVHPPHA